MTRNIAGQRIFGILAGGGRLPLEIAESLIARGSKVHIVAFRNEADADFSKFPITWVSWGQVGAILRAFNNAQCTDLVIVGRVSRPDLGRLRPDFGLFAALPSALRIVAAGGDDSILRGVTKFFEGKGFRVVGPGDVAPELLIEEGPLGSKGTTSQDDDVIAHGLRLLDALSPYDVGQAVVISDDLKVEAIEGIEGTDAMLSRVAKIRQSSGDTDFSHGGFLIKAPKRGQDMRVDLPAIGPDTIKHAVGAKLNGLALHAGHVLAADKRTLIELADAQNLSVIGVQISECLGNSSLTPPLGANVLEAETIGANAPIRGFLGDATLGGNVLMALNEFATGGAVVVTHGHVLGIETAEGVNVLCQRIAQRKQWGNSRWNRRRGIVVLRDVAVVTAELIAEITVAGFAGFAVLRDSLTQPIDPEILAQAEAAKLSVGWVNLPRSAAAGNG